ncbi:hypothetical protein BD779DRAFT_1666870 [Infundibulicybe gibba]|nr:hypothetical protein BD779DRAFT_1666870 [Infundibulicybe gibba]
MDERADLVRKSRKLAQMFGQPPEAESLSQQDKPASACPTVSNLKQKHHRGALSMTNDIETSILRQQMPSIQSHAQSLYDSAPTGRRCSIPLSPDEMTFMDDVAGDGVNPSKLMVGGYSGEKLSSDLSAQRAQTQPRSLSPTSFIDISDEEVVDDGTPVAMGSKQVGKRRSISPSRQSLYENMSPEDQAEEERRRRREKLAKLHRFLGSRVPTNLVLGFDIPLALPPLPDTSEASMNTQAGIGEARKVWLRRRRSSSAAAFPSTWSDEVDRLKEDLNDREKAINVRRAQKMEKVFGVAPPQTLYHTRHSPSPSVPAAIIGPPRTSSKHVSGRESPVGSSPPRNNANTSAHAKSRTRRNDRPSTSGSDVPLIPTDKNNDNPQRIGRNSLVYTHYQHSLKSLSDILDRDDKESLAELHQYLNTVEIPASPAIQEFSKTAERRPSVTSLKSERRRSLPARTSLISIASEYSMAVASPKPDVTDFQLRRRRAAKLTQFFGVDYRDLINDVLESIENGLEHERKRGTLRADEVEVCINPGSSSTF